MVEAIQGFLTIERLCRGGRLQFLRFPHQQQLETPSRLGTESLYEFADPGIQGQPSPGCHFDYYSFLVFASDQVRDEVRHEFQGSLSQYCVAFVAVLLFGFFSQEDFRIGRVPNQNITSWPCALLTIT